MFIVLSPLNPDPMYKQVMDQIKDSIASGILMPGDKLPSIRELSLELKISIITTKRAYSDLENEGYIITRPGLGSFVADIDKNKLREAKLAELVDSLEKIIENAEKFDIKKEDIFALIKDIEEKTNE
ncbi:MAG: GntR family transcriptional regulator [Candidatus Aminicenantes bacterium]